MHFFDRASKSLWLASGSLPPNVQPLDALAAALSQVLTPGHNLALVPVLVAPNGQIKVVAQRLGLLRAREVGAGRAIAGQLLSAADRLLLRSSAGHAFYVGEIVAVPAEEGATASRRNAAAEGADADNAWIYAEVEAVPQSQEAVQDDSDGRSFLPTVDLVTVQIGRSARVNRRHDGATRGIGRAAEADDEAADPAAATGNFNVRRLLPAVVRIFKEARPQQNAATAGDPAAGIGNGHGFAAVAAAASAASGDPGVAAGGQADGESAGGAEGGHHDDQQREYLLAVEDMLRRAGLPPQADSMQLMDRVLSLQRELQAVRWQNSWFCRWWLTFDQCCFLPNSILPIFPFLFISSAQVSKTLDRQRHETAKLLEEREELVAQRQCTVCRDETADANVALVPCGHVFCGRCVDQLQSCPTCRSRITGRLRIYAD